MYCSSFTGLRTAIKNVPPKEIVVPKLWIVACRYTGVLADPSRMISPGLTPMTPTGAVTIESKAVFPQKRGKSDPSASSTRSLLCYTKLSVSQ
jgi:hypothetical protein